MKVSNEKRRLAHLVGWLRKFAPAQIDINSIRNKTAAAVNGGHDGIVQVRPIKITKSNKKILDEIEMGDDNVQPPDKLCDLCIAARYEFFKGTDIYAVGLVLYDLFDMGISLIFLRIVPYFILSSE